MDIPVVSAFSVVPQTAAVSRLPVSPPPVSPVVPAGSNASGRNPTSTLTNVLKEAEAGRRTQEKEAQEQDRNASPAEGNSAPVGRIRFELEDGTRVAKFFDTKDVLIYQVPPEGRLYLVKSEESSVQDKLQDSA